MTYQELRALAEIICGQRDWDSVYPKAVVLVEADIEKSIRVAEIVDDSTVATTIGQDYIDLPASTIEVRKVQNSTVKYRLEKAHPEMFLVNKPTGEPAHYYVDDNRIYFDIKPGAVYSMLINRLGMLAPLTELNNSNAISIRYPNVYLYGISKYLFMLGGETTLEGVYSQKFDVALAAANKLSRTMGGSVRSAGARWTTH